MDSASPLVACSLHKRHAPSNLTVELHHVIPVGWQVHVYKPPVAPYPGKDSEGRGELWDARTIPCCPTGHRNVHYWIVKLMHAVTGEDPLQAESVVKGKGDQFDFACQALLRFKEAGGSLQALIAAHEYGQV